MPPKTTESLGLRKTFGFYTLGEKCPLKQRMNSVKTNVDLPRKVNGLVWDNPVTAKALISVIQVTEATDDILVTHPSCGSVTKTRD